MMHESDLNGIRSAIGHADVDKARELLRDALQNPTADTYYLASQVALNTSQQVQFLEKAIELDPFHQEAVDALAGMQLNHKSASSAAGHLPVEVPTPRVVQGEWTPVSLTRYTGKSLVPLITLGVLTGIVLTLLVLFHADPVVFIIPSAIHLAALAVLIAYYWKARPRRKRWLYQMEILVLYLTASVTSQLVGPLVDEVSFYSFYSWTFILAYGAVWVAAAIIGGNILLFAKIPGVRVEGERTPVSLTRYSGKSLVPLVTLGIPTGIVLMVMVYSDAKPKHYIIPSVIHFAALAVLIVYYWKARLRWKRWLYHMEILVLYLTASVTSVFVGLLVPIGSRVALTYIGSLILAYGAVWVAAAIIGGSILLFAKAPGEEKSEND
jgi:hypothetical protein